MAATCRVTARLDWCCTQKSAYNLMAGIAAAVSAQCLIAAHALTLACCCIVPSVWSWSVVGGNLLLMYTTKPECSLCACVLQSCGTCNAHVALCTICTSGSMLATGYMLHQMCIAQCG